MTRLASRTGKLSLTFALVLLAAVLLALLLAPILIERAVRSELAKRVDVLPITRDYIGETERAYARPKAKVA